MLQVGIEGKHALSTTGRVRVGVVGRFLAIDLALLHGSSLCCTDHHPGAVSPRSDIYVRRTYSGRPSSSMRFSEAAAMATSVVCRPSGAQAQRITDHSLVAADIGLHQGTPIVTRCPLPAHATALGDQLQVPVAFRRRGLCRCAWHRARTWRHNDRRIRMTLADLTVDIVAIVRPIASKRRNRARNLLQQGTDLRAVIDFLAGQLGGNNLSRVGVHPACTWAMSSAHTPIRALCARAVSRLNFCRPTISLVTSTGLWACSHGCGYRKSYPGWRRCRDGLSSLGA